MRLSGKRVLVTGGARGIGAAMVRAFVREGARVCAVDVNDEALSSLESADLDVTTISADISTPHGIDAAMRAVEDRLDVLCNNAAIANLEPVDATSKAEWDRQLAVNLSAPFFLTQRALEIMVPQKAGVIINTGSVAALRGVRAGASYTASKWGLAGLTQNVAGTYGRDGIRCNMVCPGGTISGISPTGSHTEFAQRLIARDRERPERQQPEQVAAVAVFLATPEASSVNGAIIPVDQGALAF